MALFDFPRVHFGGDIDINVPTINNTYYFPLTIYDATRSEAYLPPRLYFSTAAIISSVKSSINPAILFDKINTYYYIEITPIHTIPLLRTWCTTKLGTDSSAPDADYLPYYKAADKDLVPIENGPGATILGCCPGYWNMYGDMSVQMNNVHVTGVQTFNGANIKTWTSADKNIPTDISSLLNASFDLDTYPATGITTASMVETISSQSVYANIFCSNVNLYNSKNTKDVFLQGTPFRFSALIYGAWRVVNWLPPMAGSGRFCSSIPIESISNGEASMLVQFFNANRAYDKRTLRGVFVTFTTFEVYENRYDQDYYTKNGTKPNPAQCTTVGSITPWYEGDMRTGVMGRNLISLGMAPIYNNTNASPGNTIPVTLIPAISSLKILDNGNAIFSVDMGNSWPEFINPTFSPQPPVFMPTHRGDASFETPDLGDLILRYNATASSSSEIARIKINPTNNSRRNVFASGCIFDFVLTDKTLIKNVQSNLILGFLAKGGKETQVIRESEYMISSDQKGLYTEQGYPPSMGYQVYDEKRLPCRVRIFQKGVPVTNPIKVAVAEYIIPEAANDPLAGPDKIQWQNLADNSIVALSDANFQLSNNAVYYFVYDQQYPNNAIPPFNNGGYTVMDTGSFVCLRVHPTKDYSRYIDPSRPDYTPPTFDIVYQEIFKMYDVAYPVMALIHPFTADVWDNGTIAGLVLQRTDPKLWNNILYMPKSRELSASQLALLKAWAKYVSRNTIIEPAPENPDLATPSLSAWVNALHVPEKLPFVHSGTWARQGNKLLLIGGIIGGFHGLSQEGNAFNTQKANKSIWVIDLSDFSYSELPLNQKDPFYFQFSSSNMQFCRDGDILYLVGGYGIQQASDPQSNYTFDKIISIQVSEMIRQVELQGEGDASKAIISSASSPLVQVTGGELVKVEGTFYLMFGQNYGGVYQPGQTGNYTNSIRKFRLEQGQVSDISSYTDPMLHRRDLPVAPITQRNGTFYAAFGGVFTDDDNGYSNPVYIHIVDDTFSAALGTLIQKTNQYKCAKASLYNPLTDTNSTILFGGIGRYQYDTVTHQWEDGDSGAKLPFVKTITQMIFQKGTLKQYIQIPPLYPELPDYVGANAIFLSNPKFLYAEEIIDHSKLPNGISSIGILYGGIQSLKPTSSAIYPTSVNNTIYEVFINKKF